jgi:hypothetical protein
MPPGFFRYAAVRVDPILATKETVSAQRSVNHTQGNKRIALVLR